MKIRASTDGACKKNPGVGGWGFVIALKEQLFKNYGYHLETTNNRMEITAVIECIYEVRGMHQRGEIKCSCLEIHSDSAYVVNAFKNKWIKKWQLNNWKTAKGEDVKNKDLWLELIKSIESSDYKINFIKVKGHSGNTMNEIADDLACKGADIAKRKLEYSGY